MRLLQMNGTKTEFIIFGTSNLISKINLDSITVGGITVNSSQVVKFLGTILDQTLYFRQHVVARVKLALYGIHFIKIIWKYLTLDTAKLLLRALVLSQLDYIKFILTNTPLSTTNPYQKVLNQAAQIEYKRTKFMKLLQLLPIRHRNCFKLPTIVYKTQHRMGPTYPRNRFKIKKITLDPQGNQHLPHYI